MTEEQIKKLIEDSNKSLLDEIAKQITASKTEETDNKNKEDEAAEKAPVFKGDPTDIEAVKKHRAAVKAFELRKDVDFTDSEQVDSYLAKLEAMKKVDDGDLTPEQKEIKKLEDQIKKLRGGSRQSAEDVHKQEEIEGFSKEQADLFAMGRKMAAQINKGRGYKVEDAA